MGGEANLTTARHIGLSIEAGGASEPARFILLLGTSRHECVLEPDEVVFDVGGPHSTRMYMLEQWIAHLHGLRTTRGGTLMLPYHFADQCSAWLRVTSPDGVTAEVQAGWSLLSEFGFDQKKFAGEGMLIKDFDPIPNARILRPLDDIIRAVTISRDHVAELRDL
ncbi:hypothetical protein MED01_003777 [Micromonospora sp. MED01]|uniref:hypothetical protein n=1 Tax=Micromonospora alfalfae TaxID=2911212 RepID=UPI001EE8DA2E|nr:hypothetical protein [Micromonospora alfalfae]MCG5465494.1 hypothetical protein [Micromonospora alfalfae]